VAKCEGNIGIIYLHMKKQNEAMPYFRSSYRTFERYNFLYGEQLCLVSLGICHMDLGNNDSAVFYQLKALDVMNEIGHEDPTVYMNLGLAYMVSGDSLQAEEYLFRSKEILEEKDPYNRSLATLYQNLAVLYSDKGQFEEAIKLAEKSREMRQDNLFTREGAYTLLTLAHAYRKNGDYKKSALAYRDLNTVKDSIYQLDNLMLVNDMKTKYETEKKELEIESLNKEKNLEQEKRKIEEEKVQYFTIGGILIGLLLVWVVVSLIQKSRDNKRIKEKNQEIEIHKAILSEKNNEILSSISYAQRIQDAILPPADSVHSKFADSFILYLPKDIVSGDFYWYDEIGEDAWVAVADCTGHGVPGAMVSVVCHNALNRAVREFDLIEPGAILDKVRELVIEQFSKSDRDVKDGMDIALCRVNKNKIQFAGAHNPLWIIRNGELTETKSDKQPIGIFEKSTSFTTHSIEVEVGDQFYIFSDGYADQFGGDKGKKMKAKAFKSILLSCAMDSFEVQKRRLEESFHQWKGELEQLDDVCVIGFKF
jgi:serine phosphatase RsbU (regulator of sigma subunit)/Tfp pilus assembly protein PilF